MLATRERAVEVRPSEDVQQHPSGLVPVKPTHSWIRHLRRLSSERTRKVKFSEPPNTTKSVARRTVGVESKIVSRLLNPERGTIHELGIQKVDGQFNDREAEAQYKEFIRRLRVWSLDSTHPENDPLHEFNEYHTFTFKRVYRKIPEPGKQGELRPYICLIGFNSEAEVKRGHAKLASTKVHGCYCPLLGLCYDLEWEQLSGMLCASFLRGAPRHTLCGSLISIGEGNERRVVTVGGLITNGEVTWGLTAGHLPKETRRNQHNFKQLTENDIDLSNFGPNTQCALLLVPPTRLFEPDDTRLDEPDQPDDIKLGEVDLYGDEWALIRLRNEAFDLPNCVVYDDKKIVYLLEHAESPLFSNNGSQHVDATIMGGVTGPSQVRLLCEMAPMRLPGGKWVDAWVAETRSDSQLKKGDSGSWVTDPKSGIVYGHVLSISGRTVYILPLVDIFQQITEKLPVIRPKLATPFASLSRLAMLNSSKDPIKAGYYAEEALRDSVVNAFKKRSADNVLQVDKFIQWASKELGIAFEYTSMMLSDKTITTMTAPGSIRPNFGISKQTVNWKDLEQEYKESIEPEEHGSSAINLTLEADFDKMLFRIKLDSYQSFPESISYIESVSTNSADILMKRYDVPFTDCRRFIADKRKLAIADRLCLVIQENVKHPYAFDKEITSLDMGTYEWLFQEMKLPFIAAEASAVVGPFFWWRHHQRAGESSLQLICRQTTERHQGKTTGWEIILSYSTLSGSTSGYVRWSAGEHLDLSLEQLIAYSNKTMHPLTLPILVLCHKLGTERDEYYRDTRHELRRIESTMMQSYQQKNHHNAIATFEDIVLAIFDCRRRVTNRHPQKWLHVIEELNQMMQYYWNILDATRRTSDQHNMHQALLARLTFLGVKLRSAEGYINTTNERLDYQLHYALSQINERRSKVYMERLAESKRQEVHKRRKGKSGVYLKSLSAVFVPAIFVSAFFRTRFFNFTKSRRGQGAVSNKIFIFFAVTVPLIAIVIGISWTLNRRSARRAAVESDDLEKRISRVRGEVLLMSGGIQRRETESGLTPSSVATPSSGAALLRSRRGHTSSV
ncbi:hypothetical protein GGR57DRAFT_508501 [Xylariaceae sp. FL1272]|nr:hypothetical protein GGR57DRAFT_508501 [Xylariaceae sp. FL1272]